MRSKIRALIEAIIPFDEIEKEHIYSSIQWIDSEVEIFRIQKPDIPPKHLVSYIILIDKKKKKMLLINHIKSGLWLPAGGHVEKDENPAMTVKRELQEELGISPQFMFETPFFVTITKTINTDAGHTDVSLWYLLIGDSSGEFVYDKREMNGYKWFSFQEVLEMNISQLDPHLHRFTKKVMQHI